MNYVTKEFLIQLESPGKKTITDSVRSANRAASYCRLRLGDDYAKNESTAVEGQICPDCGQLRDCFILERNVSPDGRKRVIKARCMHCEGVFFAYQESPQDCSG